MNEVPKYEEGVVVNQKRDDSQKPIKFPSLQNVQSFTLSDQENRETSLTQRQIFLRIAAQLLTEQDIAPEMHTLSDQELGIEIQRQFQENIRKHFVESGLAEKIEALRLQQMNSDSDIPLDEQATHLVTQLAGGIHGWVDMMPSLRNQNKDAGMNCTMGSAVLHAALEKLGFQNVRTLAKKGHYMVMRTLKDGSIKIYNVTESRTVEGQTYGDVQTYPKEHISNQKNIDEKGGRGIAFTVTKADGQSINMYGYDSSVLMDSATMIGNLAEIKDDVETLAHSENPEESERYIQAVELCRTYPELKKLDSKEIIKQFDLFDAHEYL